MEHKDLLSSKIILEKLASGYCVCNPRESFGTEDGVILANSMKVIESSLGNKSDSVRGPSHTTNGSKLDSLSGR